MAHTLEFGPLFDDVAQRMRSRHFRAIAEVIRARIDSILARWREQSLMAMPGLRQITKDEFEDSMASILRAIAAAMETDDPAQLRIVIEQAPLHGADRLAQHFSFHALLAEAGILRAAIISELHEQIQTAMAEDEAAALHELIDLALEHSAIEYIAIRTRQHKGEAAQEVAGMRRLANLGTLVAGVAHDASNLILPLRMGLDHLKQCCVTPDANSQIQAIEDIVQHFQNTIVNLRWLTVDAATPRGDTASLSLYSFARDYKRFFDAMLPREVSLEVDIPEEIPSVRVPAAALAQILFNLIRNAHEAIIRFQPSGRILLQAVRADPGEVILAVADDGPGMSHALRERCFEPFVTTKSGPEGNVGGLGLSLVHALVINCGGSIEVKSPAPHLKGDRGTAFILRFPCS
mgnify:CR=1 FL=1